MEQDATMLLQTMQQDTRAVRNRVMPYFMQKQVEPKHRAGHRG